MNEIYVLMGEPLASAVSDPNSNSKELLESSVREVNSKLTGYVAPEVMRTRRLVAWSIFCGLLVLLISTAWFQIRRVILARALKASGDIAEGSGPKVLPRTQLVAWIFMASAVLSILIWSYYPLFRGMLIAFENYRIIYPAKFVGLDNFIDIFYQPTFWYGVRGSFLITFYSLTLGFALPIILALALSEIPVGKVFFRSLYYLPAVTSSLVVAFLWKWLEDGTPNGLLNTALASVSRGNIGPINWLGDPHWAMLSVVLPSIWAYAGPGCIIYLAAMRGISDEMYEAAELDGAGIWTKIWSITIPTLRPLIYINLLGATINAFKSMDTIFAMTGGGPQFATHTLGLEVFYNSFLYLRFGAATAAAWIMGMLLVGFTFMQLRMMRDMRFSAAKN
jgi:multiple sugar transport system permease protein